MIGMARKLRVEYSRAIYRVIKRGNYRQTVFVAEKTEAGFEHCRFEVCRKHGWRLYAFVVINNCLHMALKSP